MLIERFHPVTHDFGLINLPLDEVVSGLRGWHNGIGIRYRRESIDTSLEAAFESLLPLSMAKQRRLMLYALRKHSRLRPTEIARRHGRSGASEKKTR